MKYDIPTFGVNKNGTDVSSSIFSLDLFENSSHLVLNEHIFTIHTLHPDLGIDNITKLKLLCSKILTAPQQKCEVYLHKFETRSRHPVEGDDSKELLQFYRHSPYRHVLYRSCRAVTTRCEQDVVKLGSY